MGVNDTQLINCMRNYKFDLKHTTYLTELWFNENVLKDKSTEIELICSNISYNNTHLRIACQLNNIISCLIRMANIIMYCTDLLDLLKVNTMNAFNRLHLSNMSIFDSTEEDAIKSVNTYLYDKKHSCITPGYKKVDNLYIIYDINNNKILSSHKFFTPIFDLKN